MARPLELDTTALGVLREKDGVGDGDSRAENLGKEKICCRVLHISMSCLPKLTELYLSLRFSFTVGGEGAATLCRAVVGAGSGAGVATVDGLTEGVKENAEGAEGVSEGGLEPKEKPEEPEPKGAEPPREKAAGAAVEEEEVAAGTEKTKEEEEEEEAAAAAVGTMLKREEEEEAAGAGGVAAAAGARLRLGKTAAADGMEAAALGGCAAKEPVKRRRNVLSLDLAY